VLTEVRNEAVGLRAGEAAGAASDEPEPGRAAVCHFLFGETEWAEEVERAQMAPVVEGGGPHADDHVGPAVDANGAANDVGVTPIFWTPKCGPTGPLFGRSE
jgi:hypothetical protein